MSQHLIVELSQQPIELCKLLKVANLVGGGGEAKIVISEGYVLLNGVVEYQKRKKIYHQDIIEFNGDTIEVEVNEDVLLDDNGLLMEDNNEQDFVNNTLPESTLSQASLPTPDLPNKTNKAKSPKKATQSKSNRKDGKTKGPKEKSNTITNDKEPLFPSNNETKPRKRNPISF